MRQREGETRSLGQGDREIRGVRGAVRWRFGGKVDKDPEWCEDYECDVIRSGGG